jgi:lipoprotein-anchoring transpeptidase ErfK/SrfK
VIALLVVLAALSFAVPANAKTAPKQQNFCAKNTAARKVIVRIATQRLYLCDKKREVFRSRITTGAAGDDTPKGTFSIQRRARNEILHPAAGGAFAVDYWVAFIGNSYGFHNAPWQTIPFGEPALTRTGGSHGCIRMPHASVAVLYNWVRVGTPVVIS